jgi:hypothetical protein
VPHLRDCGILAIFLRQPHQSELIQPGSAIAGSSHEPSVVTRERGTARSQSSAKPGSRVVAFVAHAGVVQWQNISFPNAA